jgi:antiviral helicase SKI2
LHIESFFSVSTDHEKESEGHVEGEPVNEVNTEEVQFDEPIDLSAYDQFSLSYVVQQRLARHAEESQQLIPDLMPASQNKPKKKETLNIQESIKYEEDEEEIKRVEEIQKQIAEKNLADAMNEISIDIEDAEEEDSEDEEPLKGGSSSKYPSKEAAEPVENTPSGKPGNYKWAVTTKLPPRTYEKLRPKMAVSYPFELDEFQKQAVLRLERRENVFVAAHTSAGKTVVAEYGIALALKNNSRAVYTSPIKALSNQKYRDFKDKFGVDKVGIVTGDVSVNPAAQCLIMTTEIFRSMLYKGSDTTRDIEFVIFDEVHYVNDAERGVVWEEVIIMLPSSITLIFLSATTPNAQDFSDWIGRTKQKRVHLISTNKRPVPLQHFLYFDNEMFKLMEGDKNYNAAAIPAANKHLQEKLKPKPQKEENAKMQQQRMNEKAGKAAQVAGNNSKQKQQQIFQQMQQQKQQHQNKPGSHQRQGGGGGGGSVGGGKTQWTALIKILQQGGREAAGGLGEINFGVARSKTILSKDTRKEKQERQVKYESLPEEMRKKMTKKEYEATEYRSNEEENEKIEGEVGLLPVVVFSFSKKRCEELADFFKGQDFLTQKEKSTVHSLFSNVLDRLNPVDADLPQILRLKDMLLRGFGVHHGGLLPILKETVELLFTDSIVKVLFATETFAMG